ncbi:MAG: ATP-dependent Clp protease ATP-binding subunit [Oscillospiraceae bacterium]|nr:ATP-dependent Clp protease ATP-binding subunit [Oscillospiraceae bacterium]
MNEKKFTPAANKVISLAYGEAVSMGHGYVGSEHLLLGIMRCEEGRAAHILSSFGLDYDALCAKITEEIGSGDFGFKPRDLSPKAKLIIRLAAEEAAISGKILIDDVNLLSGILRDGYCTGARLISEVGISPQTVLSELFNPSGSKETERRLPRRSIPPAADLRKPDSKLLRQYTKNLTAIAQANSTDPLIGRKKELERVIGTLCRRTKNNPVLVGDPGVGKTAIAEGLAGLIVQKKVPPELENTRLLSLDLSAVIAGTKYRGDFEERIRNILSEVISDGNTVLFIDELHTLVGAGGAEGAIDAANILKPALARGELRLIGATTLEEYRRFIEKDAALERRFQKIDVSEPTFEEASAIVLGLRSRYEEHHGIKISDGAILAAVALSERYIPDRFLPDKALDLLDEASSHFRLNSNAPSAKLESEDVAKTLSLLTGIPVSVLNRDETELLINLEARLSEKVFGQKTAVSAAAAAIRRGRTGLTDPNRPICSMMFLGPSGVGKTELCLSLADVFFGGKKALIRLDMSEYSEKHTVSKLIGSPPGYAGYEDGGQLTEKIRRKPYSLVLFDELEKAHPDVFNILLRILEDGALTDSHGRTVSFKNTVIVMTSNIGANLAESKITVGFGKAEDTDLRKETESELKKTFSTEFLNRIDVKTVFNRLSSEDLYLIAEKFLSALSNRLKEKEIGFSWDRDAVAHLLPSAEVPGGARPLRQNISDLVEAPISKMLLSGELSAGDELCLTNCDSTLRVAVCSAAT